MIFASKYSWVLLLLVFACINFLASLVHTRFDLTKEKRYTISNATKGLLHELDDEVKIDVFLKGDLPSGFKKLSNTTGEFLDLLKEYNGSKIHYRFLSPDDEMEDAPGKKYSDTLTSLGASPINLSVQVKQGQENKLVFPVAWIRFKDREALINLYPGSSRVITANEMNDAEAMMEYQFAKTFDAMLYPEKPFIAYSSGNGEPSGAQTYDLQQSVRKDYRLFTFNINTQKFIPDTIKVLLIVKPSLQFTADEKLKIDQYLMRGGKLLCFLDGLHAEQDSLKYQPQIIAYDRGLDLTDLLFHYGTRINPDLIMDLQCDFLPFAVGGSAGNPQFEFLHWNYYPLFESKGNHAINRSLGLVAGRFVNSMDTVKAPGITKTILLSSSSNTKVIGTPALISLNENRNTPQDAQFTQKNKIAAVLLEGKFSSLYKDRMSSQQLDTLSSYGTPFKSESTPDNKMIIVSDGDIVLNDVHPKQGPLPMGLNLFTVGSQYEYQFANRNFLLNCLEYLTNKQGIIETRNKEIVLRLLDPEKLKDQRTGWQLANIALPVLLIMICGFTYQQIRKKKYAA